MKKRPFTLREQFTEAARDELSPCVVSSGGRPTNPDWDMRRALPLSAATYEALQSVADQLSTDERIISPMQVAAFAVEKALFGTDS